MKTMLQPIPIPDEDIPCPPVSECGEPAVDLTEAHPRIVFLASYHARGLTASPSRLYLRRGAAERLLAAADALPGGLSFAVFDALRPAAVQQALFDEYRDTLAAGHPDWDAETLTRETRRFVALPTSDPAKASNHLTGGAVDLTLARDGQLLDMGTVFDEFRPIAGTRFFEREGLNAEDELRRDNRRLLYHSIAAQGFTNYEEEWWHFDFGNRAWAMRTGNTPIYGYLPVPRA